MVKPTTVPDRRRSPPLLINENIMWQMLSRWFVIQQIQDNFTSDTNRQRHTTTKTPRTKITDTTRHNTTQRHSTQYPPHTQIHEKRTNEQAHKRTTTTHHRQQQAKKKTIRWVGSGKTCFQEEPERATCVHNPLKWIL